MVVAANTYKFAFPILVGLLEDGEDGPPSNPVEADPYTTTWALGLEQEEEHVHGGWVPQVCANNLVRPDECPAVGMKLGGGYVELSQELPLEASEGQAELDLLEHGSIDEAEGLAIAPLVVGADGLPRGTRTNGHLVIMLLAKRKMNFITFLEAKDVNVGVDGRGLTQQS